MCRLFGLTAGITRVRATFWLLDAPDSLEVQSHSNFDGSGIGFFDSACGTVIDKQPEPAFRDQEFIHEAKQAESSAFVAHVRLASVGGRTVRNTHPFAMHGRIMAHNGGFGELSRLDEQLGRRVQPVCAMSSASFSDGFIYPRVLRGRLFRLRANPASSSAV